jgi:hypothetical protein
MRLSSQNSQFVFNLPSDFIPQEIINTYTPILQKNWIQYENVVDYLNSTIKSINYPGLTVETPEQKLIRGKVRAYKPAKNVQDILSSHEIQVTFRSVDSDLNYWICYDIFTKHYLDTDGKIYGYELDGSQDYLIGDKTPITREEVDALIAERYPTTTPAPAPTKEELMAKLEALAAQIAALG